MTKKIYLAAPYSDHDPMVSKQRFFAVTRMAGEMMNDGLIVYSPITSSHPVAMQCSLPTDWEYWKTIDTSFIEWCDELWVCMLDGWNDSAGIKAEVLIADKLDKPVKYYSPGK